MYYDIAVMCIVIIMIFVGMLGISFAVEANTSHGSIAVDPSVYHLERHQNTTVYISGEIYQPKRQEVRITITIPDSKIINISIISTDSGSFLVPLPLTINSQIGTYYVSGETDDGHIGQLSFTVLKNDNSPAMSEMPQPQPQPITSLTITTDQHSYQAGDTINVFGETQASQVNDAVTLMVSSPNGIIFIAQVSVDDGEFSIPVRTGGNLWSVNGTYTIKVNYREHRDEINFLFMTAPTQNSDQQQIHETAYIKVTIPDRHFDFGDPMYQMQDDQIRFENNDGDTIHRYSAHADIGRLFTSLDMEITDSCITFRDGQEFCKDNHHDLIFNVGGEKVQQLYNYIPNNNDTISITYKLIVPIQPPPPTQQPPPIQQLQSTQQPPPTQQPPTQQLQSQQLNQLGKSTDSIIVAIIVVLIIIAIIIAVINQRKSAGKISGKKIPTHTPKKQPKAKHNVAKRASTMFYYECPKCHDPDISNNLDGSVLCTKCGFAG